MNGLFLEAKSNALRRKDMERAANREATEAARGALREASGVEKRLERVSGEAGLAKRRAEERDELAGTLEAFLARPSASLE